MAAIMTPANIGLALELAVDLASQVSQVTQMIQAANAEKRDLTPAEIDSVVSGYLQAHASLDALIQQKLAAPAPSPAPATPPPPKK